jgi:hypothetical protein
MQLDFSPMEPMPTEASRPLAPGGPVEVTPRRRLPCAVLEIVLSTSSTLIGGGNSLNDRRNFAMQRWIVMILPTVSISYSKCATYALQKRAIR